MDTCPRVAVVQLDYDPAILVNQRSPLEDPLFTRGTPEGGANEP
jgi:hypothetical protein